MGTRLRLAACLALLWQAGCASMKESDTARTGVEQLLISTAVDRTLDKVSFAPMRGAKVFVEEKYLDCNDKNYVIVSLHQRLMRAGCTLVDKADDAEVILEVASGAVGTDRNDLFLGIPPIPLAMPSPVSIPKVAIYERAKAMGTAKLRILAYDAKTRQSIVDSGAPSGTGGLPTLEPVGRRPGGQRQRASGARGCHRPKRVDRRPASHPHRSPLVGSPRETGPNRRKVRINCRFPFRQFRPDSLSLKPAAPKSA